MKLIDIANRIDKSKSNEAYIDTSNFNDEFQCDFDYIDESRMDKLKAYWIGSWYCTDSCVGYRMYFLNDKPVAFSAQIGRKYNEEFEWFSKELALEVRNYLISLIPIEGFHFSICDINKEVGDTYKIDFNDNLLTENKNRTILNGKPIEILERIRETHDYGMDTLLRIKLQNGEEKIVDIREIDFKFYLYQ